MYWCNIVVLLHLRERKDSNRWRRREGNLSSRDLVKHRITTLVGYGRDPEHISRSGVVKVNILTHQRGGNLSEYRCQSQKMWFSLIEMASITEYVKLEIFSIASWLGCYALSADTSGQMPLVTFIYLFIYLFIHSFIHSFTGQVSPSSVCFEIHLMKKHIYFIHQIIY